MNRLWQDEKDIELLKEYYPKFGGLYCFNLFNGKYTREQIKIKAYKLKIRHKEKDWINEEYEILKNFYQEKGSKYCRSLLPHRSISRIQHKAKELGLSKIIRMWTKEEEKFVIEFYSLKGARFCAEKLNRIREEICQKAFRLGIKKYKYIPKEGYKICFKCKEEKLLENFAFCNEKACTKSPYCKDCEVIRRQERRQENPKLSFLKSSFKSHRGRGYIFNFKEEDLLSSIGDINHCQFCGIEFCWLNNNKSSRENSPSLDRTDNLKIINSVKDIGIICPKCNATKSNRSLKEFIDYMELVLPKLKKLYNKKSES